MPIRQSILALLLVVAACSAQKADNDQALFGDLPTVEAVSLHAQTLAEAPANVTVITAGEISHYGYRTLAEALASVPGFYVTYDHQYHYVGVSGINLPGDYNTRFLVMLNGHPLTNNIYNSNGFFGEDFGIDMDLVERIEIIRGPTAALYGSNGILANINVVTRSPVDAGKFVASVETSSAGDRKLFLSSGLYLGRGANLLVSASLFNNTGEGVTDAERGYHTFAQLIWHNWSVTAYFNSRLKYFPVGIGSSLSDDPNQTTVDQRNFVSTVYRRSVGPGQIEWQTAFDQYRYHDRYDYPVGGTIDTVRDYNRGDWLDSELTYTLPLPGVGPLTVGGSGNWELRAEQYNLEDGRREDYSNHPDRGVALFAQQEWRLSDRLQLYAGLRLDDTRYFGRALSPRLAAVYQQSSRSVYKLVYGRPFRNPSAFEQFYNDGGLSYLPAPPLRPEIAGTLEFSAERRWNAHWTTVANAYRYAISRVIDAVSTSDGVLQYRNGPRIASHGVELSLTSKLWKDLEATASGAFGHADGGDGRTLLANSPTTISKLRLGVPLWVSAGRTRLFLAGELQYISARQSWTGARLGGAPVGGFTLTTRLYPRFDLEAGIRNVADKRYEDPVYLSVDRMRGDGRSVYLRLVWHASE